MPSLEILARLEIPSPKFFRAGGFDPAAYTWEDVNWGLSKVDDNIDKWGSRILQCAWPEGRLKHFDKVVDHFDHVFFGYLLIASSHGRMRGFPERIEEARPLFWRQVTTTALWHVVDNHICAICSGRGDFQYGEIKVTCPKCEGRRILRPDDHHLAKCLTIRYQDFIHHVERHYDWIYGLIHRKHEKAKEVFLKAMA